MSVEDVEDVRRLPVAELDAERADKHEAVEPVRTGGRDLRGEPAAERGAHERDLVIRKAVNELAVEVDEIVHRFETIGPGRRPETRMRRRQDEGSLGQSLEEKGVRIERVKAVQKDDRPAAAAPDDLELDVTHRELIGARRH